MIDDDPFVGRIATGRIASGVVKVNDRVKVITRDGARSNPLSHCVHQGTLLHQGQGAAVLAVMVSSACQLMRHALMCILCFPMHRRRWTGSKGDAHNEARRRWLGRPAGRWCWRHRVNLRHCGRRHCRHHLQPGSRAGPAARAHRAAHPQVTPCRCLLPRCICCFLMLCGVRLLKFWQAMAYGHQAQHVCHAAAWCSHQMTRRWRDVRAPTSPAAKSATGSKPRQPPVSPCGCAARSIWQGCCHLAYAYESVHDLPCEHPLVWAGVASWWQWRELRGAGTGGAAARPAHGWVRGDSGSNRSICTEFLHWTHMGHLIKYPEAGLALVLQRTCEGRASSLQCPHPR